MYYIGVDLGGTNIAIGICDKDLNILVKDSVPTLAGRPGEEIVKDMADLSAKLMKKLGLEISDIGWVGIASPGIINFETGVVEYANNLKFENFAIADIFKKYLPVDKVLVENDANAACLAETLKGAAKGVSNAIMITLGTGVGGGIVIDKKIYSGFNHAAAELGHTVIRHGGRLGSCGRRGCFEAYCSATALIRSTIDMIDECEVKGISTELINISERDGKVTARTAFDAMRLGDKYGQALVDSYISYLACGVSNLINIFQPEVLIIGGGVCNEKKYLTEPLMEIIDREQYTRNTDPSRKTKIMVAALGNDAGIVGAAGLGF